MEFHTYAHVVAADLVELGALDYEPGVSIKIRSGKSDNDLTVYLPEAQAVRLFELLEAHFRRPSTATVHEHPRLKEGAVRAVVNETAEAMRSFTRIEGLCAGRINGGEQTSEPAV